MAYTKQTWSDYPSTATPITAATLDHIEQGIFDAHEAAAKKLDGPTVEGTKGQVLKMGETGPEWGDEEAGGADGLDFNTTLRKLALMKGEEKLDEVEIPGGESSETISTDRGNAIKRGSDGGLFAPKSINPDIIAEEWDITRLYKVGEYCIRDNTLFKCLVQNTGDYPSSIIDDENENSWQEVNVGNMLYKTERTISDAYSPAKAYTVGERCIYQNKLYKCINNTSAGVLPTNTTYFVETTLDAEIPTFELSGTTLTITTK